MGWHKLVLSRDAQVDGIWQFVQGRFEMLFMAANGPELAAMFTDRKFDTQQVRFYFSPAGTKLIGSALGSGYALEECPEPPSEDVTLLVGHDSARDTASLTMRE